MWCERLVTPLGRCQGGAGPDPYPCSWTEGPPGRTPTRARGQGTAAPDVYPCSWTEGPLGRTPTRARGRKGYRTGPLPVLVDGRAAGPDTYPYSWTGGPPGRTSTRARGRRGRRVGRLPVFVDGRTAGPDPYPHSWTEGLSTTSVVFEFLGGSVFRVVVVSEARDGGDGHGTQSSSGPRAPRT